MKSRLRYSKILFLSIVFIAIVATILVPVDLAQKPSQEEPVQANFSAEDDGVKRPVAAPNEVMGLLAKDHMVRTQMENEEPRPEEPPAAWFSVSEIQLGPTQTDDLIVQAAGPLAGANVDTFWIFVLTSDGWKLALAVPAHNLIVMRSRFGGYRKIEADAMTCCSITTARFRFDGTKYMRYFSKSENIK
jgi:hypothetical protein